MVPFSSVADVRKTEVQGQWKTKSGGILQVPLTMTLEEITTYVTNNNDTPNPDIRGLRMYIVDNLSRGSVGGGEFHKIRDEIAITLKGSVEWSCEDVESGGIALVVREGERVRIPPYILHTYKVVEPDTTLVVIANTLFGDTKEEQDSFTEEEFKILQKHSV